jgi:hypothetical protein
MDDVEEAGLRAFARRVGAYAGVNYPERPAWIELDGERIDVAAVDASWHEEERLGFRVRLTDGSSWLLYYVPELDLWSGVADSHVGDGSAASRGHSRP